mgnify:CR=1 FL=1|tara:strand:- start:888 stop:1181 length:294 start_codon:yes stop_codon:yes gene_type:complete
MELSVLGASGFTLGFRLSGIKKVIDYKNEEDVKKLSKDKNVGIVIVDQSTFDGLNEHTKEEMVSSINPIFVVVSSKPQEELRKMIIRSIGVDLLRDE